MARSKRTSSGCRPTAIAVGVLLLIVLVAIAILIGSGSGGDSSDDRAQSERGSREPPSTTTTTLRPPFTYTVKAGDTLTALAAFFSVSTDEVVAANPGLNPDRLVEGQQILIPSPRPVELVVRPRRPRVGGSVRIELRGAREFENIRFEIQRPTGPYVGPPHAAAADGLVTTSYSLGFEDPPGKYIVIARGDKGTNAQTEFEVRPAG